MTVTEVKQLSDAESVVFFHAHPDDETLSGGALLAALAAAGRRVAVVTATRGEQGEVIPGVDVGTDLVAHRERERSAALAALGVTAQAWLGGERHYTDSGMRWIGPGVAGPAAQASPDCLSSAPVAQAATDLVELLHRFHAEAVVSYDAVGGYHHPDHVACHHIARVAAEVADVALFELVSPGSVPADGAAWLDHPEQRDRLVAALRCYPSQFRVVADEVVHVGGQHQPIDTGVWLFRT